MSPAQPAGRPGLEVYIYYQVAVGRDSAAVQAVEAAHQALCLRYPGLTARLLKRSPAPQSAVDQADAPQTWMEIYTLGELPAHCGAGHASPLGAACGGIPAGQLAMFLQDLEDCIGRAQLPGCLLGPRHVEFFEPQLHSGAAVAI